MNCLIMGILIETI